MSRTAPAILIALAAASFVSSASAAPRGAPEEPPPQLSAVPFTRVTIDDAFWAPRRKTNCEVSVPHQYAMNKETGRIDAWRLQWKPGTEPKPHIFWDSDVAKWIESASNCLAEKRDPVMEGHIDDVVELMAKAQLPDGYLNSHFIQVEPDMRWKNLGHWHELYCAGHLMEAAVAYYEATGKRRLLDVIVRYADHIDSWFGPGKHDGTPGHPEVELALVKLYRATGEKRYLDLALFFLDQRGQKPSVFQREMEHLTPEQAANHRAFFVKPDGSFNSEYNQDHLPVREQTVPVGHAVRAMYLYSGMADVGALTGDRRLIDAGLRIWDALTTRRMYVTGGIGPSGNNEGFTADYDLPNDTAYCETCASVGLVFWAHRLLQIERDGRFADVLERALYNGALAGIALDGKRFFYDNPLESDGTHHRQGWFGCACCPGNISRLIASLGSYLYSEVPGEAWVHLYAQGRATLDLGGRKVLLSQKTRYPWDGEVEMDVEPQTPGRFALHLRVPGWARGATVSVNGGAPSPASPVKGYARLERAWKTGDRVTLSLPMPVERVRAHPNVKQDAGLVALQRGPLVYCLEGADNPWPLHRLVLPSTSSLAARHEPDLLGGVTVVEGAGERTTDAGWEGALYRAAPPPTEPARIRAVPYYAWDHRAPGEMRVFLASQAAPHGTDRPPAPVAETLFLIGDAGKPAKGGEPVLIALRREVERSAGRSTVAFLGDNLYPAGLPAPGDPDLSEMKRRLDDQVDVIKDSGARAVFIPGNHDWRSGGRDAVRREEERVEERGGDRVSFLPHDGCPGPDVVDVGERLRLVALDTQWWLQSPALPHGPSPCSPGSSEEILAAVRAALDGAGGRDVVVLAHHPLESGGPHGGRFGFKQHLFPLTEWKKVFFLPLPLVGSAYPLSRSAGIVAQDIPSDAYRRMRDAFAGATRGRRLLAWASGHEHGLQVIESPAWGRVLVSGAGIYGHVSYVREVEGSLYRAARAGFMRVDFPRSGPPRLSVLEVGKDGSYREAYARRLE